MGLLGITLLIVGCISEASQEISLSAGRQLQEAAEAPTFLQKGFWHPKKKKKTKKKKKKKKQTDVGDDSVEGDAWPSAELVSYLEEKCGPRDSRKRCKQLAGCAWDKVNKVCGVMDEIPKPTKSSCFFWDRRTTCKMSDKCKWETREDFCVPKKGKGWWNNDDIYEDFWGDDIWQDDIMEDDVWENDWDDWEDDIIDVIDPFFSEWDLPSENWFGEIFDGWFKDNGNIKQQGTKNKKRPEKGKGNIKQQGTNKKQQGKRPKFL